MYAIIIYEEGRKWLVTKTKRLKEFKKSTSELMDDEPENLNKDNKQDET